MDALPISSAECGISFFTDIDVDVCVTLADKGMVIVLPDLNLLIALEVRTFDCSLGAFRLVFLQLNYTFLDLATKLAVLAGMWNYLNHVVDDGVRSISEQLPSAGWTALHIHLAAFTNNVSNGTRSNRALSRDEETHRALEFTQESFNSCC